MSLINGIGSLGVGLSTFAAGALKDELDRTMRTPLLSFQPSEQSTPAPASATPLAPPNGGSAKVPPDYLPIYQAAAKRTGIPIDVLIAQAKQESNFNPDAVGSAGEIGLHQIKPSTAADPGFGLKGIDPAMLKDPAVNINFAADYLRARAGSRIDFSNPRAVDAALAAYNGGGDSNYVANVRSHMGAA